jgi:hypothetical protein
MKQMPRKGRLSASPRQFGAGYTTNTNDLYRAIFMECDSRSSSDPLAQPVSALENRDLLRSKDAANRFSGILGICLARAHKSVAIPQVDCGDGALRPP